MSFKSLLQQLSARLPELEWKISHLGEFIPRHALPPGLFHYSFNYRTSACIAEIKSDIRKLALQTNQRSACYLAEKIHQKISVLISLSHDKVDKKHHEHSSIFDINRIHSKQQWLKEFEERINKLLEQRQALSKRLRQAETSGHSDKILALKHELGQLERYLTLAKESFHQLL
ncbi:hypothetical protein E3983_12490 [Legionella israelensis]|uniref:Coiled-coil protein n=1 Tax=Legionella israelensis TaxID=454 RepID=A0A0W0V4I2_9GAMM|nr:primosomal replication protein PriC [Legionella israelensis]KTD14995.1 coiled-coil protein [Legionella israelensis]QBR85095.1 hypothetical protein E3983_12490 [Legionella israelensis]QBS10011.1 hypothetical protein E4T55_09175 [Legionella israelensis]SCX78116.1 Primosomal replication protein priC [Legionella israelensis DSM 19235]STX59589.1 coiled-coil protein [Legionella israelensis]